MGVARKNLSADSLIKIVKYSLLRDHFKSMKNTDYSWQDCIMSVLSVFDEKGIQHEFNAYTDVPLNDANYDYRVNVLSIGKLKKMGVNSTLAGSQNLH